MHCDFNYHLGDIFTITLTVVYLCTLDKHTALNGILWRLDHFALIKIRSNKISLVSFDAEPSFEQSDAWDLSLCSEISYNL